MGNKEAALQNLEKAFAYHKDPAKAEERKATAKKAGEASANKRKEMKEKLEAMEKLLAKPTIKN